MKKFELIHTRETIPMKTFIYSANKMTMHWHRQIELLLVLEGSIKLKIATDEYEMHEDDLILLNTNQVHGIMETSEENILLSVQIEPSFYNKYFLGFNNIRFDCKSFLHKGQDRFDVIRYKLAKIVWEVNKKVLGYELNAVSYLAKLGSHLINNFPSEELENDTSESISRDIFRLNNIIEYIDENISNKITLKDLADDQGLSTYYLSHYIKRMMGISFQQYINLARLNLAIDLLLSTDKTITEIAIESGFASIKSFNTVIKRNHNCTPTEYREKYKKMPSNFENGFGESKDKIISNTYLDVDTDFVLSKLFDYLDLNTK